MSDVEVALTRCYFCGKPGDIVMNRLLTQRAAAQVKEMHGKVISMHPCHDCEEMMKQGVMLLVFNEEKSTPGWDKESIPNPHRTGDLFLVKDEAVSSHFPKEIADFALQHRFIFITDDAAEKMGLLQLARERKEAEENGLPTE